MSVIVYFLCMEVNRHRLYNSPHRAEKASATARRILEAATSLFAEQGFASVTMQRIARQAGISLATVYLHFPGKAAIIAAMANDVTMADDLSVEQVELTANPLRQLQAGARIFRLLNERSWLIADVLRSARGDASLTPILDQWLQQHLDAIRRGIAAIQAQGALRDGLSPDEAIDAFYALGGTDVYRALVRERGWSPDEYERWLLRLSAVELLGIPPGDVPRHLEALDQ